jgi:hypothetical protein
VARSLASFPGGWLWQLACWLLDRFVSVGDRSPECSRMSEQMGFVTAFAGLVEGLGLVGGSSWEGGGGA